MTEKNFLGLAVFLLWRMSKEALTGCLHGDLFYSPTRHLCSHLIYLQLRRTTEYLHF